MKMSLISTNLHTGLVYMK